MNSMTGFGNAEVENKTNGQCFKIETTSVNRKQLDIRLSLPRELTFCEVGIRKLISSRVKRGAVFMKVELLHAGGEGKLKLNRRVLADLMDQARSIAQELQTPAPDMNSLVALPGVIESETYSFDSSAMPPELSDACEQALKMLLASRQEEGAALYADIKKRLDFLRSVYQAIVPLTVQVPQQQQKRLLKRLDEAKLNYDIDDEKLLKEIVFFTDRSDVSEETVRLEGHFEQFEKYMNKKDGAIGRSLDFMVQEIAREINTLGNKAASTKISPLVVEFKTGLEKIREQIQNIE